MIFRMWREWRQRVRMTSAMQSHAEEKYMSGEMTADEYEDVIDRSNNPQAMKQVIRDLKANPDALGAIDWDAIKEWLIAHWSDIMRLLMTVVMLMDDKLGEDGWYETNFPN